MRILQIITQSNLGGAQSVLINLSNKLSEDHEVIVAAGEGDGKIWELLSSAVHKEKIQSLKREISPWNDLKTLISFRRIYAKYQPDIIHLHSSKAGALGRMIFPIDRVIYTMHGFDSIRIAYRQFLLLERILQWRCKAVVDVSKYDKTNLIKEGIKNHVTVVYNGIYKPASLGYDPFEKICRPFCHRILCIARLSPQKKVDLFLETAALLPQYDFIWIGNQYSVTFEIPENVHFMGNIPNAGSYTEYADLLMLPSNYEGLPIVIIEAMSMGKPVVASNVGGISEIVKNGENGFVLENDAKSFCEKIDFLLTHQDLYHSFSQNSYSIFNTELTVDQMVNSYMKLYME